MPALPTYLTAIALKRQGASLLLLSAVASSSWAAPTSTEELAGSGAPATGKAPASVTGATAPDAAGQLPASGNRDQTRTMELLLQLQDKPSTFAKDQATAASGPSLRRALAATAASDAAADSSTDVLGSMKKSMLGDGSGQGEMRADAAPPTTPGTPAGALAAPRAAENGADSRKSLLSNPVVRYIRENRALVIGVSLGLLAAVWLAAGFSMRRRR